MGALAAVTALVDLLKKAGIIRDRQQEASIQSEFVASTSGPLYGLARVIVIYASLWDIFFNQAQSWARTGLPPILEYLPVVWLFIGPAIVPFAEAALRQALAGKGGIQTPLPRPEAPKPYRNSVPLSETPRPERGLETEKPGFEGRGREVER